MRSERIVIAGGGFAGVTLAQEVERLLDTSVEIVVISRYNHLVFTPLLPEVAGRTISPFHVAVAGRTMTKRTRWIEAEVTDVNAELSTVGYSTSEGLQSRLSYTHLVLACGSDVNLNAIPGMMAHSIAMKTATEAILLGNEIIARFEEAASEQDAEQRRRLLTTVVIGGGFSGVEIGGQLNDLMARIHPSYPQLQDIRPKVIILQRADRLIPEFSRKSLSDFTLRKLLENGLDVRLHTQVAEVTERGVLVDNGALIPAGLVVCTIGTVPSRLISNLGFPMDKGRLRTQTDLQVQDLPNVWALGDCAVTTNAFDQKPTSPTAQFAIQEARHLARNLHLALQSLPTKAFHYRPQGLLASIGRRNGVAEIYGLRFSGWLAWVLWRAVYLFKMPSLSTRIGVALDWLVGAFFGPPIARLHAPGKKTDRKVHFAAGDLIYQNAQASRDINIIQSGAAKVYVDAAPTPFTLEKGDYFGTPILGDLAGLNIGKISIRAETSVDAIAVKDSAFSEAMDLSNPLQSHLPSSIQMRTIVGKLLQRQIKEESFAKLSVRDFAINADGLLRGQELLIDVLARTAANNVLGYWVIDPEGRLLGFLGRLEIYSSVAGGAIDVPISSIVRKAPPLLHPDQDIVTATLAILRSGFDILPVGDASGKVTGLYDPIALLRESFGQPHFDKSKVAAAAGMR